MIKIYNTFTNKKEKLQPIYDNIVNIYVCGVTVYDYCHIGHARTFIIFDIIIRYLYYYGYQVNYIRNITDIEDKIIQQALKNNESYKQLTNRMICQMKYDFDKLNILRPNHEPRATHFINEIIEFIQELIKKKNAYISINGDVMFSINTYKKYGNISHQNLHTLKNNISKNTKKIKKNYADFVLWKMAKPNEPNWKSPWGVGRPGWHTECVVMSNKYLGYNFDIHGGGKDLIFPHHENEVAQSTCIYKNTHINTWIHVGLININKKKMSKSSKNTLTIKSILTNFDAETIRYFLISSHYRSEVKYDENYLKQAKKSLETLYISLRYTNISIIYTSESKYFIKQFIEAMNDDFNTPLACSILFNMAHKINNLKNTKNSTYLISAIANTLKQLGGILGILQQDPNIYLQKTEKKNIRIIEKLIKQRNQARKNKQWKIADDIRKELKKMNILIEDTINGTTWRNK